MKQITKRQREALTIIHDGIKRGLPPTFAELRERLNVNSNQTVRDLLDALARKGYLTRKANRARAIMLREKALKELDKRGFFDSEQLRIDLNFFTPTSQFVQINSDNISIVEGQPDFFPKQIWDNSQSINKTASNYGTCEQNATLVQPIINSTNWNSLKETTKQQLKNFSPLVISFRAGIDIEDGYTIFDNHPQYCISWSGVFENHYFFRGKEHGSTKTTHYISTTNGQLSLFPFLDDDSARDLISELGRELKSFSQWVDFPIYGGILKRDGDILFWSHHVASDPNDLRNLLLADATGIIFKSYDAKLLRDIKYNFSRKFSSSSTSL